MSSTNFQTAVKLIAAISCIAGAMNAAAQADSAPLRMSSSLRSVPDESLAAKTLVDPIDARLNPTGGGGAKPDGAHADGAKPSAAGLPAMPVFTVGKDYRLAPSDLLDVEVLDADNLKRTVRVNATGAISLPLIGQVTVAGLTSQQAEARIAEKYGEKYLQNPQVTIFIKEFSMERITVEGAVARPGIFPLTGQITLLRALAMAGGFGSIADPKHVMIYRTNDQRVQESNVYDIERIRAGKDADPPIKGDDLIVVQRDSSRVLLKDSLFRDFLDSINPFSVLMPKP